MKAIDEKKLRNTETDNSLYSICQIDGKWFWAGFDKNGNDYHCEQLFDTWDQAKAEALSKVGLEAEGHCDLFAQMAFQHFYKSDSGTYSMYESNSGQWVWYAIKVKDGIEQVERGRSYTAETAIEQAEAFLGLNAVRLPDGFAMKQHEEEKEENRKLEKQFKRAKLLARVILGVLSIGWLVVMYFMWMKGT